MFAAQGHRLVLYDPAYGTAYPYEAVSGCGFAVVCVGTPEGKNGKAWTGYIRDALADLPPGIPVLLRSTVPPGTTDVLIREHPRLIAHAPEFMHEREGGQWAETTDVPFLILGGQPEAREFFRPWLAGAFPKIHECAALTAELVKYTINLHLAARVTFINEMDAICRAFGVDWENVRQAWLMDPRITPEYTGGIAEFGPGFGGRCWPKDLAALIAASRAAGYIPEFLEDVEKANRRFREAGE